MSDENLLVLPFAEYSRERMGVFPSASLRVVLDVVAAAGSCLVERLTNCY